MTLKFCQRMQTNRNNHIIFHSHCLHIYECIQFSLNTSHTCTPIHTYPCLNTHTSCTLMHTPKLTTNYYETDICLGLILERGGTHVIASILSPRLLNCQDSTASVALETWRSMYARLRYSSQRATVDTRPSHRSPGGGATSKPQATSTGDHVIVTFVDGHLRVPWREINNTSNE